MANKKYIFNFSDLYSKNINLILDDNFRLNIERQSNSTASLYCINKENQKIIPYTFKIINITSAEFIYPVNNIYILCWTDNYEITYQQKKINLNNMHLWDIKVTDNYLDYENDEDYPGSNSINL
jgi:hypothetical protein